MGDGKRYKIFVKIGTSAEAIADFNSLGPTSVRHVGNRMTGQAGNQYVIFQGSSARCYSLKTKISEK